MIIINNMDTEKISLNRRETLLEWARNGGWLIFGAGDQAVKTLSGFSKDLGIKVEEVMTSEDDYSLAKVSMDQSDQISVDENGCAIYQRRRLGNGWVGIVAVSYTHLDVYKRQLSDGSGDPGQYSGGCGPGSGFL